MLQVARGQKRKPRGQVPRATKIAALIPGEGSGPKDDQGSEEDSYVSSAYMHCLILANIIKGIRW